MLCKEYWYIFIHLSTQLYLEAADMKVLSSPLRILFQTIAVVLAFLTCLSRIADNKHFWGDVLSGAILGAVIAAYMVRAGCLLLFCDGLSILSPLGLAPSALVW